VRIGLTTVFQQSEDSIRHSNRYTLWLSGKLDLKNGKPNFDITAHGLLDHGILYAPHIFHDAQGRILQLGWADEASKAQLIEKQGWAGILTHPRELYQISRPICDVADDFDCWDADERLGTMTTLGIRPAPELNNLEPKVNLTSLNDLRGIKSTNFEFEITLRNLSGHETFEFRVRESLNGAETTKIVFNLGENIISIDRTNSSLSKLGSTIQDGGPFSLLPKEDLRVRILVDNSIVEVFANDRFSVSSRIYPSLENSVGVSYDIGVIEEGNVGVEGVVGLRNAWPVRNDGPDSTCFKGKDGAVENVELDALETSLRHLEPGLELGRGVLVV
jgi:beta-fructofuranosidase